MERARQDLAQHDLQKAVQEYAEILKLDPRNAEIYSAEGVALYGLGRTRQAAEALQKALSLDPGQSTAELFLGLSQSSLGKCNEAIPLLRRRLGPPTPVDLRRVAGISLLSCYRDTAQYEQALDLARTLKKSFPADADVLYNVAELYTQLWDVTASELLKDHPESYRVHQLAGQVLEAQGKYPQAIKEYQLAIRENDKIPDLHYRIGKILLDQDGPGADDQAIAYFKQELQVNPDDAAPEYSIAEILRQQRQFSQAERHFRRALQMSPDFVEAHVGLGQTLLAEHQLEAARRELEKAAELRPDDPAAHYGLMMVYRDSGKPESAAKEMALFQELTAKQRQNFRSRLRSLLSGKDPARQPSR
ncbi:MAG TPA: tetratricopeptide repeat protein [Terriglobia bacterium]|nr:tetratricopeptide repeat protein [Terriglobia bacterium]